MVRDASAPPLRLTPHRRGARAPGARARAAGDPERGAGPQRALHEQPGVVHRQARGGGRRRRAPAGARRGAGLGAAGALLHQGLLGPGEGAGRPLAALTPGRCTSSPAAARAGDGRGQTRGARGGGMRVPQRGVSLARAAAAAAAGPGQPAVELCQDPQLAGAGHHGHRGAHGGAAGAALHLGHAGRAGAQQHHLGHRARALAALRRAGQLAAVEQRRHQLPAAHGQPVHAAAHQLGGGRRRWRRRRPAAEAGARQWAAGLHGRRRRWRWQPGHRRALLLPGEGGSRLQGCAACSARCGRRWLPRGCGMG